MAFPDKTKHEQWGPEYDSQKLSLLIDYQYAAAKNTGDIVELLKKQNEHLELLTATTQRNNDLKAENAVELREPAKPAARKTATKKAD